MFPPESRNQAKYGGGGNRTRETYPHTWLHRAKTSLIPPFSLASVSPTPDSRVALPSERRQA